MKVVVVGSGGGDEKKTKVSDLSHHHSQKIGEDLHRLHASVEFVVLLRPHQHELEVLR